MITGRETYGWMVWLVHPGCDQRENNTSCGEDTEKLPEEISMIDWLHSVGKAGNDVADEVDKPC